MFILASDHKVGSFARDVGNVRHFWVILKHCERIEEIPF